MNGSLVYLFRLTAVKTDDIVHNNGRSCTIRHSLIGFTKTFSICLAARYYVAQARFKTCGGPRQSYILAAADP